MAYNGWTNYATWAVALWVDNDEGSYRERRGMAEEFTAPDDHEDWAEDAHWYVEHSPDDCQGKPCGSECDHKERVHDVSGFAAAIKEWVTDAMIPDLGASLASDLLSAALSEVDWHEIAENWLSE